VGVEIIAKIAAGTDQTAFSAAPDAKRVHVSMAAGDADKATPILSDSASVGSTAGSAAGTEDERLMTPVKQDLIPFSPSRRLGPALPENQVSLFRVLSTLTFGLDFC
jgi:hypothetical protein